MCLLQYIAMNNAVHTLKRFCIMDDEGESVNVYKLYIDCECSKSMLYFLISKHMKKDPEKEK